MMDTTSFLGLSLREPMAFTEAQDGRCTYACTFNAELVDQFASKTDGRLTALEAITGSGGGGFIDMGTF